MFSQALYSEDRVAGLIWGSFYGDALGGPYEFQKKVSRQPIFKGYKGSASAFGTWERNAPKGSITDDSRHKMLLINALVEDKEVTSSTLANEYIKEFNKLDKYSELRKLWLKEYVRVATWVSSMKGFDQKPPGAIWSGMATVSGQLTLIPLAVKFKGQSKKAYLKCWELNWLDNGTAKDINCALVAALAHVLQEGKKITSFVKSLKQLDPFHFKKVPFVGRPLDHWLQKIEKIVSQSLSSSDLKRRLLKSLPSYYWWEDYTVLTVTMSYILYFKDKPEKVLKELIKFGKDTDTYAQLAGAILGAIYGKEFFNQDHLNIVKSELIRQHNYDLDSKINKL